MMLNMEKMTQADNLSEVTIYVFISITGMFQKIYR